MIWRTIKRALASRAARLAFGLTLLGLVVWTADWRKIVEAVRSFNGVLLTLGMLLFVPQTLLSAMRWKRLVAPLCRLSLGEAVRHTLAASAMNLVIPSKMGDLTKAAMLPIDGGAAWAAAGGRALVEKIADVLALALLWLCASAGAPTLALAALVLALGAYGAWRFRDRIDDLAGGEWIHAALGLTVSSLGLWTLHLAQIHLFLRAAGVPVDPVTSMARVPAAIFAGLAPVSLWGIGVRDTALVWLFADVAPAAKMAAVGLLTASRYLVPGIVGIVFVGAALGNRRRQALPIVHRYRAPERSVRRAA